MEIKGNTMDYNDLLGLFPQCDGPNLLPFEVQSSDFCYVTEPNPRFTTPTFRLETATTLGVSPSVVLLSAPAAMGKSAVAKALAYELQAPLWNLSKFTLGEGTLTGIPRRYFGSTKFNVIENGLRSGSFLYILDALDEARARPGHGFESFLEDLCEETRDVRTRACAALLGRTEASGWAALYFEENDVPFVHYSIDFFGRNKSEEFIDKYLDHVASVRGSQSHHRNQRNNFISARDHLFSRTCEVLGVDAEENAVDWTDPQVREFIGYAPVLEVLSDFLDDTNYYRLRQQMSDLGDSFDIVEPEHAAWQFLRDVVSGLLHREQRKLLDPFRDEVSDEARAENWNDWELLYTVDEQCERVLCHSLQLPAPTLPEGLPARIRQPYTDAIEISDHAFMRDEYDFTNVVFRDYLYAWAFRKGSRSVTDAVKSRLIEDGYKSSPLLAHFYLTTEQGEEPQAIDAQYLGYVYESLLSKESISRQILFMLEWSDSGSLHAALGFGDAGNSDLSFSVSNTGGTILFPRFLRDADIVFPGQVCLGRPGSHFDLGPAVRIVCDELQTSAPQIRVSIISDDSGDVIIEADHYNQSGGSPPQVLVRGEGRGGALLVNWSNMAHPWAQYQYSFPSQSRDARLTDAVNRFVSILAPFRGRRFGGLTRARKLIDNRPVGRTPMGRAMLVHLLSEGILRVDGRLYRLDLERLGELGVTWHTLSRRETPEGLIQFLNQFLAQNPTV